MSFGGIKRTPADIAFSKTVREANDYVCEYCGIQGRSSPSTMDLSHYFGRRHRSTRWEPLNAFCLCRGCHNKLGESPHDHATWARKMLGEGAYKILVEKKNQIVKIPKTEEKAIAKHYREEYKKLLARRAAGATGKLNFVGYF